MESIDERAPRAESLWARGEIAESAGDLAAAYALFTQAHDLVVDCARLHRRAHERLRRVNRRLPHRGELATDWLLHLLAPLGFFELVSFFARGDGFASRLCRQRA
ncbi:MAG: hypothetical protein H6748_02505 [Spirochaetaceae bacterium]|nr:hypothetical protein [Spirochaetaceae bacterium]HPG25035.1 hypothetical protein [Myxococcota bacterium]